LAFNAYAEEIILNEKEALCMGFKWEGLRQSGIELFVPPKIGEFSADFYVADFTVLSETVFIVNAPINTNNPAKGISIGFLDSGQSGGEIKVFIHYKSVSGFKKTYQLPSVSKLMHYDFEQC
jgi:hypothetical protein